MRAALHEVVVSLEMKEPGDFADDDIIGRVAKLAADAIAMGIGGEECFDLHAAVDRGELFARGDAGGDELVGHGVGDADDRIAASGREDLTAAKQRAGRGALVRMKRRAVDCVDDRGHVVSPCGGAAEESCLAAVGVDDVGSEAVDRAADGAVGGGVVHGMNVAPQ